MNGSASLLNPRGIALLICAPSGTGKTSVIQNLLKKDSRLSLAVSVTTRLKRIDEQNGEHYHFVDPLTFDTMIKDKHFIEYTQTFKNYYGTPKTALEPIEKGHDVVFDLSWEGVDSFYRVLPQWTRNCISILLVPPSRIELQQRLEKRNTENAFEQEQRLKEAALTLNAWSLFDYGIVCLSNNIDQISSDILNIIDRERKKFHRLLEPPLKDLLKDFE